MDLQEKAKKNIEKIRTNEIEVAHAQQKYIHKATAENTRRAYRSAIKQFELHGGLLPATTEDIARYITGRAHELNPRTLSLHITALGSWHTYQNLSDPTQSPHIRKLITGIYREHGKPKNKARALHPEDIAKMVTHCKEANTIKSIRDSAIIQIAYFGAFRRSEVVAIKTEHLSFESRGLLITIPKSKTDQSGEGKIKALPFGNDKVCPVSAIQEWLQHAGIKEGYVFRPISRWGEIKSGQLKANSINTILKNVAKKSDIEFADQISSHGLRRGFATSAANAGADFAKIKKQGGWSSDETVRGYIEEGELFKENAASNLMRAAFVAE